MIETQKNNKSESPDGVDSYILFELANTTYGVKSHIVKQMEMVEHITPVPNAPSFVEGVVFLRGQVIPVIDLRLRFGFEKISYDLRTRLVVVNTAKHTFGLIVDSAREFVLIPDESIKPTPEGITNLSGRYIDGIAKLGERLVLVLNADEVFNLDDIDAGISNNEELRMKNEK